MIRHKIFNHHMQNTDIGIRLLACEFANQVLEAHDENTVVSISESFTCYGVVVTLWYFAEEPVECTADGGVQLIRHITIHTASKVADEVTRGLAQDFTNKMLDDYEENSLIGVTECYTPWGMELTVWYYAKKEVSR